MSDNEPAKPTVFISYAREDSKYAERLYNELKKAGFKPWLDKHNLIAGQNWEEEIKDAIENNRFFIPLFSSNSVQKIKGFVNTEYKFALDYAERYAPRVIFAIPVRVDDCNIPFRELRKKHTVDLFPDSKWKDGINSIIQALKFDKDKDKDDGKTDGNKDADNNLTTTNANAPSLSLSSLLFQKPSIFRGEKSFFVGREEYINKIIKDRIRVPLSRVCIVGPGGSGKSQLAFRAIHQYEKEWLFDLVVPVYFSDVSVMSFSDFLLNIAKSFLDVNQIGEFEKLVDIEHRKTVIHNFLDQKSQPLLFLDNYETVSYIINYKNQANSNHLNNARKISYFLNNELPSNTSVLVTSRERKNNFGDKELRIDLKGLQEQETINLFSGLTSDDYLKNIDKIKDGPKAKSALTKIFKMTGGHPLSIEIIAKNTSSIHEIQEMADTLGIGIVNPDEPKKRLQSIENSFDYTISNLPDDIKKLLYYLTLFKSPFPIDVAKEIFNMDVKNLLNLHNRSLVFEIKSETSFGEITNPDYWLYSLHPAIRNHLENTMEKVMGKSCRDLKKMFGQKFSRYYRNLIFEIHNFRDKANRQSLFRCFDLISEGEENDFEYTIKIYEKEKEKAQLYGNLADIYHYKWNLSKAKYYSEKRKEIEEKIGDKRCITETYTGHAIVLMHMGKNEESEEYYKKAISMFDNKNINNDIDKHAIVWIYNSHGELYNNMGNYDKALEYHYKALEIDEEFYYKQSNDETKNQLAWDYRYIGIAIGNMGNYDKALEYHYKALEIDEEIEKNNLSRSWDYKNIGKVYCLLDRFDESLKLFNKKLDIDIEMDNKLGITECYALMANLYNLKGDRSKATELLSISIKKLKESGKESNSFIHKEINDIKTEIEKMSYLT